MSTHLEMKLSGLQNAYDDAITSASKIYTQIKQLKKTLDDCETIAYLELKDGFIDPSVKGKVKCGGIQVIYAVNIVKDKYDISEEKAKQVVAYIQAELEIKEN